MNQLHNNGFVHGDIKPENLLIDKNLNLVIADFNFAVSLESKAEQKFSPLISRHH
jgi:phosphorylase kinase gamma subunit